jgi:hypothetical protein
MIDYKDYLDGQSGISPEKGQASFNNIVYLVGMVIGIKFQKANMLHPESTVEYEELFEEHCDLTEDENGLYAPKNSHDNITMKLAGSIALNTTDQYTMSLFHACKGANFHPRDVVLYCFLMGSPVVSFLVSPLLIIPAITILFAAWSSGKIRPRGYWKDLIINRPKLIDVVKTKDGWIRTYLYRDNTKKSYRLHQNDGKILAFYRLLITVRRSFIMRLTAKLYERIMAKKYCSSYMLELYYNYFPDGYLHPTCHAWYGVHLPLKQVMEKK